ncbi:hypothetical protein D3C71_1973760 [compost metagenome]
MGHARNAGDDGQEDHWRNDHLDQLDERVTQRLELSGKRRLEVAEQHTQNNGHHHLKIQLSIKRQPHGVGGFGMNDVHKRVLQKSR